MNKCQMCGAPMENTGCSYCGYIDEKVTQPKLNGEYTNSQTYNSQPDQSQTIINNQYFNNSSFIPGISKKSKTTALVLCIFLGYSGVHKFYVGKIGMGIIYFFTFGLFGFGWIIDIILIATNSFKDEFDLPLKQ